MNLAWRDIRHKLGRFILTCLGLSLLLGVVITMAGIYRGQTGDALALARAINADLWIVEAGTSGPFAEASRIPGDTREIVARINGVVEAGSITFQNVQIVRGGRRLRLQVVGYEPGRPGGPVRLIDGRDITRSHYELIADRQTGFAVGETVHLGRYDYTVVGVTSGVVTLSGDSIVYMALRDAQQLQFDLAPPAARREAARGAARTQTDLVNAVVARLAPDVLTDEVAEVIRRWKHLSVLTEKDQEQLLTLTVIERARRQLGLFMGILTIVSAVIIALIIYTLTMDKVQRDRDAQADRRAGPHDHRPHPAAGAALGDRRLHRRHDAGLSLQWLVPPSHRNAARGHRHAVRCRRGRLPVGEHARRACRPAHRCRPRSDGMMPWTNRAKSHPLVEIKGIAKHFGEGETRVDALRDITLSVSSGEVVGLIGPSGSGKSTLLNVIGAIIDPNEGWMRLDGEVVYDNRWLRRDLRRMRLEKIGFIFQTHNLLPFLDATDNVALVFHLAGVPRAEAIKRSVELLEYLQVGHRKQAMPAQLSGGEAQRVAIARALANKPRIILADEPTAPLDSVRAGIVMDLLRKLARDQQAAIIAVTHDEKIYDRLDRIYKLRDGQLIETEERVAA